MKKANDVFKDESTLFQEAFLLQTFTVKCRLSDFLLRIRTKEGMTQENVASGINVTDRSIRRMETDALVPIDFYLKTYAYYLQCGYITAAEERLFRYTFRLFIKLKTES